MTNQLPSRSERAGRRMVLLAAASGAGMAGCWWAAGSSLGLFFGGFFVATFLTPAAMVGRKKVGGWIAVIGPVAAVWIAAVLRTTDTISQWSLVTLALVAYSLAIGGIAAALERAKLPEIFAAGVAMVIGFAWMTWPVWLSPTLVKYGQSGVVQGMIDIHPPLVANGVLSDEPAWTERSVAYQLTNLNQDMPVRLPSGVRKCVAIHGLIAAGLFTAAFAGRRDRLYSVRHIFSPEKS